MRTLVCLLSRAYTGRISFGLNTDRNTSRFGAGTSALAERRRADARIDIRRTPGPESEGDKASRNPAITMLGMGWRLRRPLLLHMPHPERTGASRKLQ